MWYLRSSTWIRENREKGSTGWHVTHYNLYFQSLLHYYHIKLAGPYKQAVTLLLLWEVPAQIKLLLEWDSCRRGLSAPCLTCCRALCGCKSTAVQLTMKTCSAAHLSWSLKFKLCLLFNSIFFVTISLKKNTKKQQQQKHPKHFRFQRLKFTQNDTNHSQICWFNPNNTKYSLCQQKEHSRYCWRCYCSKEHN